MEEDKTLEQKAAETILQTPVEVNVNGKHTRQPHRALRHLFSLLRLFHIFPVSFLTRRTLSKKACQSRKTVRL